MHTRRLLPAIAFVIALVAAGCASSSNQALDRVVPVLRPVASTVTTTTTLPPAGPCDPTASLRPTSPLPAPGSDASAYSAYPSVAKIVQRGYLIAGVDQNTLLFGYRDPSTGELGGFDIDVVKAIARAIFGTDQGHVKYTTVTTGQRPTAVESGLVDIVASQYTATCDRLEILDFSTIYYQGEQEVLVRNDSPIQSVADLGGKTVCATAGSTSIDNIKKVAPKAKIYPVDARTDCLVALQQGKVDAITSDDTILAGFAAQDEQDTRILPDRLEDEPYGIAVNQNDPDLVRYVNAVLAQMRADGELAGIAQTWLHDLATPIPAARYKD
jgi:polar amino acid transport system substrate-binding protein